MSKKLTMLNPIKNTIPLAKRINPRTNINPLGIILRMPNNQKHIAINMSKTPKILTSINF